MKSLYKNLNEINKIIDELSKSLGSRIIEKIIKMHIRGNIDEYFKLLNEYKTNKTVKIKGFNRFDLYRWKKGSSPDAIRTLKKVYFYKLHKINKKVLARLVGWGLGDGGIDRRLSYYFICGDLNNLQKIKLYLELNIPKIKIKIEENRGMGEVTSIKDKVSRKINGNKSWILYIKNSAFTRFLHANELPIGEKVLQKIEIPLWIKNSRKKIKAEFLEALLECENQKHSIKYNKLKDKIEIPVISFGMCKSMEHKYNLIDFLDSIKGLLEEFNIRCGKVETPKPNNVRKRDGKITCFSRFPIYTSALDVVNFSKAIRYKFNESKKNGLGIALKEAKTKLVRFEQQKTKFKKAKELFKEGKNYSQISRALNVSHTTVRHWILGKEHLPRHLDINIGGLLNG